MNALRTLACALFFLALLTPVWAQSQSKTLDNIAREQQNVGKRIEQIKKKMDRLIRKNELEGKQHTADLIRKAKLELEKRILVKRIEALDEQIRTSKLTVAGEQENVLKDLEDVFAILQDRSNMERLEDLIATFREGLKGISQLSDQQDKLIKETQSLIYDEAALLESARKLLNSIKNEEQDLNAAVEKLSQKSAQEEKWWSLAKKLEQIGDQQKGLANETFDRMDAQKNETYSDLAEKQDDLAQDLAALQDEMNQMTSDMDAEMRDALNEAKNLSQRAKDKMFQASESLNRTDPSEGWKKENEAADALQKAAEKMNQAGKEAFQNQRKESFQASSVQDQIKSRMQDLKDKLNRLSNIRNKDQDSGSKMSPEDRANKEVADNIQQQMESAGDKLEQGKSQEADKEQKESIKSLKKLDEMLKEQQKQQEMSGDKGRDRLSQQERQEKMKELARQQKKLEEAARDLMRRMRELPNQKPVQDLSNAADNMAGAAQELDQGMGEEAEQDEEEAKKHLEKAMKEMTQEENKYQNIRQQELLFRVQQALESLKEEQDKIIADTRGFEQERQNRKRLSRRQKKTLKTLAQRESEVKSKTQEIIVKIEEDASTVFSWVLQRNVEDLTEVVDYLKRRDTGPVMQSIQDDISDRMAELIEAMKQELKRRQEAEEPQDGQQQQPPQNQKNPLIPPVAELMMIKRMEENALRRLEMFLKMNPDISERGTSPVEAEMLERMGHRHSNVTELFNKMLERTGGPTGQAPPPSKEGEDEGE